MTDTGNVNNGVIKKKKPKLYERVQNHLDPYLNKLLSAHRRKRLRTQEFTIISNNCWAGSVYRYYGLPYKTPTVGLYFFADEYIRFVSDFENLIRQELRIIPTEESRYYPSLKQKGQSECIVGKIGDVEVCFLHYKTKEEVLAKWKRRTERISHNNVVFKFSQMNECGDDALKAFNRLPAKKKIFFVKQDYDFLSDYQVIPGFQNDDSIGNDTSCYRRYIPLFEKVLNQ